MFRCGVDVLATNKFEINFEDRTLEVNGKATTLSGRSNEPVVCRVSLAATVTVPVQAKLEHVGVVPWAWQG